MLCLVPQKRRGGGSKIKEVRGILENMCLFVRLKVEGEEIKSCGSCTLIFLHKIEQNWVLIRFNKLCLLNNYVFVTLLAPLCVYVIP